MPRRCAQTPLFLALASLPFLAGWARPQGFRQEPSPQPQATVSPITAPEAAPKVPQTVEDHLALVERYKRKAAEYRKEASEHRTMLDVYRRDASIFPNKSGREYPWFAKLRRHCEDYISRADALAAEAERFAEFHRMRAKELQGE